MSKIKSFRGLLANGGQEIIHLHTNDGSTGYKITKFDLISTDVGAATVELVCKIYKIPQTTVDGIINFSDNTLLGVAYFAVKGDNYNGLESVVFDNEIFNQDIYITMQAVGGTSAGNYYIELEQVKLDLNQNTMATLKDIKNIEQRSQI
jgi:hypothetical protein